LIGNATQALIEDVFERGDLFRGAQRVSKRIVAWGSHGSGAAQNTQPVELPHSAVVISERELTDRLAPGNVVRSAADAHANSAAGDWTIITSRTRYARNNNVDHHFGSRIAHATPVRLKEDCARDACWIESLDNGWLFLLPGPSSGWLLSVGGPAEQQVPHSRLVGAQIESIGSAVGQFPSYPRASDPLCGPGWLVCGAAAMAFDPICGDGAGNAVREAILASAVIKAIKSTVTSSDIDHLLAHYKARLLAGFLKHLELCRQFYAACSGDWWTAELSRLDEGIEWCSGQLGSEPKFRYRLRGFDLEPA
jgi:hypothetical protein